MHVLAPIDGSDCSFRALRFATDLVTRFEGDLDVVHITDHRVESTERLLDRAEEVLAEAGIDEEPEVMYDLRMSKPRYANRVGKEILAMAEEEEYDHVVMGSHGTGRIGRAVLGSATETVVRAAETPATVVP